VGRRKRWLEDAQARFAAGTFTRIAAVLGEKEDRTEFFRLAVEREIARRQLAATKAMKRRRPEPNAADYYVR
jgi:hypothetical protein